jgi:APA family basic amino acid/polyamine antiporter
VIVMRRKAPEAVRPYRTLGYPIVPVIFLTLSVFLIFTMAYLAPSTSGIGYLLVLTGIPVYFIWSRRAAPRPAFDTEATRTES